MSGTVYCWGRDFLGQATINPALTPTPIAAAQAFDSVTAGETHACAWKVGGQLYCWGSVIPGSISPYRGEIGPSGPSQTPVPIPGLTGVRSVLAGSLWTCALDMAGSVFCFGNNLGAQLGLGTSDPNPHPTPVKVPGLPPVSALGTTRRFGICAIATVGDAYCWGAPPWGGLAWLGLPVSSGRRLPPTPLRPLYAATASATIRTVGTVSTSLDNLTSNPAVDTVAVGATVRFVFDPSVCSLASSQILLLIDTPRTLSPMTLAANQEQPPGSANCSAVITLPTPGVWYLNDEFGVKLIVR